MYVLGISCYYHDSAACLLKDGEIIAAAQEERFTRIRHDQEFPTQAIKYCLKHAGITIDKVDYVGFYDKPLIKFERILTTYVATWPRSYPSFIKSMPLWLRKKMWIPQADAETFGILSIGIARAQNPGHPLRTTDSIAELRPMEGKGELKGKFAINPSRRRCCRVNRIINCKLG
jgi:predicted NodU family carbamoyl transferase